MALEIEQIPAGDATYVVAASGELDNTTAPELTARLARLIEGDKALWLAVDLSAD